jgi:ESCRT-II complex subunit
MVGMNLAVYEPPKQMRAVLLYWRLPEEWAEVLHGWVRAKPPSNPIPFFTHLIPLPLAYAVSTSALFRGGCFVVSAGDENRTAEHDTDVLRDFESARAVGALGDS